MPACGELSTLERRLGRRPDVSERRRPAGLDLGQAEVQDLDLSALVEDQVHRLQVAVHDALGVRRFEGIRDLDPDVEQRADLERLAARCAAASVCPSSSSITMKCWRSCCSIANTVQMPGMVERRRGARFALEALEHRHVVLQLLGQELDGHAAPEATVLGLVDHAHPAGAESANDA